MAGALSARETAYSALRSRILNLDLKPNDSLNDKELAQQMGMSRTAVHEAIMMLGLVRLVVVRPQSGTYVAPIDTEILEMEQFSRYTLEKAMVLRAIAEAMAVGDADAAVKALRAHLGLYRTHLRKMKDAYPSYFQSTQ